jgi:hypothetical protein
MKSRGLRVIRFRNEALEKDIWRVVEEIKRAPGECEADRQPPSQPSPPRGGSRQRKNWSCRAGPGNKVNGAAEGGPAKKSMEARDEENRTQRANLFRRREGSRQVLRFGVLYAPCAPTDLVRFPPPCGEG